MANRNFPSNKLYTPQVMPVLLNAQITIGASGAVASSSAPYISSITRLAAGKYRIKLDDNYNGFLNAMASIVAPSTGSAVASGSLVTGTAYRITVVGTTNWQTAGLPEGLTPAVGMSFVATATSAGTGTATAIGASNILSIQLMDDGDNLAPSQSVSQTSKGGYISFITLAATAADNVALIPADPTSGTIISLSIYLSNSSVVVP